MKITPKKTTPTEILKEVQNKTNSNNNFDLFVFCKLYKHQVAELPWNKIKTLFSFLNKKKIKINYFEFVSPELEKLKKGAEDENANQARKNVGLATMVKFLMQNKKIDQLEERVLFYINKNHPNETIREKAKEKIIDGNKKILIYFVRSQHFKLEHDEGEMLADGYMELRKMFEKYKPESNFKFLSYAQWSIIQVMRKTTCQDQNYIKLPLNILNQIYKLNKFIEDCGSENVEQWQKSNHISKKTMNLLMKYRNKYGQVASFDKLINEENNKKVQFEQLIPEDESTKVKINKTTELIEELQQILTPFELDVIKKIYGINEEKITKKELIKQYNTLNQNKLNSLLKTIFNKLKKNKTKLQYLLED